VAQVDVKTRPPLTALVLTGGGARAAYQVGVLRALSHILPPDCPNPFPIICGTSAGAINAAALASQAINFHQAVRQLVLVWRNFHVDQVYRGDFLGVAKTGARWLAALVAGGLGKNNPMSLLDNSPLERLLRERLALDGIQHAIDAGAVHALAITATGYLTGQSVSFFQGAPGMEGWRRARRIGVPETIRIEHLLASSSLPFVFPAVRIRREYFGDGSMRQIAPISPALHLGAERVLAVSVGSHVSATERRTTEEYPSFAQLAGHALNTIFLDTLEVDIERMERINHTVSLIPPEQRAKHGLQLREVEVLVIRPSEELEPIAARYAHTLPKSIRWLLRGLGATRHGGATLVSYMLFEQAYCRALIDLGYKDTLAQRGEILRFISAREPETSD